MGEDNRWEGKRTNTSKEEMKIESYEDLEVYKRLFELHLEIHKLSLAFPRFELYELGSQIRRSSNSAPANLAEGWNNKHTNIYLEGINRALGEIQETKHHLRVAFRKEYLDKIKHKDFKNRYEECSRMLRGLEKSLGVKKMTQYPESNTQHLTPNTQQRGIALVLALFVLLFMTLLVVVSLDMSTTDQQIATNQIRDVQTTYIADAGVEWAVYQLRQDDTYSGTGGAVEFPTGSGNMYNVTVSGGDTITSTGTIGSFTRTLEVEYSLTGSAVPYTVKITTWKEQ